MDISYGRESMADRPLGIAILAILGLIGGIILLLAGLAVIGITGIASVAFLSDPSSIPVPAALITVLGTMIGVAFLIIAIILLLIFRGLWIGSNWARVLMLIFLVLGVISSLWTIVELVQVAIVLDELTSPIITLLIELIFIYYLTRPHVVDFYT